jgi:hypothetical protein
MSGPGVHSPVGASAIKRVLACPASVGLADGIEDEESDHAALGTAVHVLIEVCLTQGIDAWERIGHGPAESWPMVITRQMANSAQVMLDAVRTAHPDRNQGNFWVERKFHCPTIHPLFYGTSDVVYLDEVVNEMPSATGSGEMVPMTYRTLHIWDYKNGVGVVIEVEKNEQCMYYACGALEDLALWDKVDEVVLHVVQPNGFHEDGPVREWPTTPDYLAKWLEDTLVPGINVATNPDSYGAEGHIPANDWMKSGEHCRFCPVRTHACPQLTADIDELEKLMAIPAIELTNEQLGRLLTLRETGKIVFKAAESTAFGRLSGGGKIPDWKLVNAGANRTWKDDAETKAVETFGPACYTKPSLKSPAQIEELPGGGSFTATHAYKPEAGLKLAPASNRKAEVSTDTKGLFTDVTKKEAPVEAVAAVALPKRVRRAA